MPYSDPEVRREYLRQWKRRNRGRYRLEIKAYDAMKHANQRAEKYGCEGVITVADVLTVLAAGKCHYCGRTKRLGIDHVEPLDKGGPNTIENLVCSCHSCNASKWRQDRPWRWSRKYDECVDCGTTEVRHRCHGRCDKCYAKERYRRR